MKWLVLCLTHWVQASGGAFWSSGPHEYWCFRHHKRNPSEFKKEMRAQAAVDAGMTKEPVLAASAELKDMTQFFGELRRQNMHLQTERRFDSRRWERHMSLPDKDDQIEKVLERSQEAVQRARELLRDYEERLQRLKQDEDKSEVPTSEKEKRPAQADAKMP